LQPTSLTKVDKHSSGTVTGRKGLNLRLLPLLLMQTTRLSNTCPLHAAMVCFCMLDISCMWARQELKASDQYIPATQCKLAHAHCHAHSSTHWPQGRRLLLAIHGEKLTSQPQSACTKWRAHCCVSVTFHTRCKASKEQTILSTEPHSAAQYVVFLSPIEEQRASGTKLGTRLPLVPTQ
jgi:hypothetical protein